MSFNFGRKCNRLPRMESGRTCYPKNQLFASDANLGHRQILPEKEIVVSMNESCRYFRCVFQGFWRPIPNLEKIQHFFNTYHFGDLSFLIKKKYDLLRHRYPSNTSSSRDMESKIGRLEGGTLTCRNRNQHLHIVRKS